MKAGYSFDTVQANAKWLVSNGFSIVAARADAQRAARVCYFKRYPHGFLPQWLASYGGRNRRDYDSQGQPLLRRNPARKVLGRSQKTGIAAEVAKLAKLGFEFSGHAPKVIRKIPRSSTANAGLAIGDVVGIIYRARRDGVTKNYLHKFVTKQARPLLIVLSDGHLVLHGGAYTFTDRGIEDTPVR